jgi:hypothetical protein
MDGSLITTTHNADLQSLGTGGQRAVLAWDQIAGYVRRSLGPAHAALFAEPNQDPNRGTTEWYAQDPGTARTLSSLAGPEREAATAELARLHGEIKETSERLRKSTREDERFLGEMLELALIVPGPDYAYVVGTQPVLVAWGHTLVGAAAAPELLIGRIASASGRAASRGSAEGPMTIVGPPAAVGNWPWKLLAGLLMLAALLLLLPTVLLHLDPFNWFSVGKLQCVASPADLGLQDEIRTAQQREGRLRNEIARVSLELGDRRVSCPPRIMEAPRVVSPPQANQDIDRARQGGARTGKVQVILAWDDRDDLDLSVICPTGQRIYFNVRSACGGTLDIDRNHQNPVINNPVENVVFDQPPAPGRYRIQVKKYQHRQGSPARTPYRVTVRIEGQPDKTYTGTVGPDEVVDVGQFDVPPR